MDDAIRKAEALIEAGSYIRMFRDQLTVIKLGGSAMEDPAALEATLQDVVFMETVGLRPVLVHGGGKPIDRAMAAAGLAAAQDPGPPRHRRRHARHRRPHSDAGVTTASSNRSACSAARRCRSSTAACSASSANG